MTSSSTAHRIPGAAARVGRLAGLSTEVDRTKPRPAAGLHSLGLRPERDAYVYVPKAQSADGPTPVVVVLHGAGGDAQQSLRLLQTEADASGVVLVLPESLEPTWDLIASSYGPDIRLMDEALRWVRERFDVDARRLGISGFSDGASYALSVGLTNGDRFSHILAYSPGFMVVEEPRGRPRVYVSHGTHDAVLPIDRCSRRLIPRLRASGLEPSYWEFDGPHTVPPEAVRESMSLLLGESAPR